MMRVSLNHDSKIASNDEGSPRSLADSEFFAGRWFDRRVQGLHNQLIEKAFHRLLAQFDDPRKGA
jgi:hypothetical protein